MSRVPCVHARSICTLCVSRGCWFAVHMLGRAVRVSYGTVHMLHSAVRMACLSYSVAGLRVCCRCFNRIAHVPAVHVGRSAS